MNHPKETFKHWCVALAVNLEWIAVYMYIFLQEMEVIHRALTKAVKRYDSSDMRRVLLMNFAKELEVNGDKAASNVVWRALGVKK
jgi:hypothetical protein